MKSAFLSVQNESPVLVWLEHKLLIQFSHSNAIIFFFRWRRGFFVFVFVFFVSEHNNTQFKFKKTWCTILFQFKYNLGTDE